MAGTRFIHKDGRVIPVHSSHGDVPHNEVGPQHAAPTAAAAVNKPAPVVGQSDTNHPEPRAEVAAANVGAEVKKKNKDGAMC